MEVVLGAEGVRAIRDWRVVWSSSKGAEVVPEGNKEKFTAQKIQP